MSELTIIEIIVFGVAVLWLLQRIAEHLKAIRTSLEVIAKATRDTADGLCYQLQIMISTDETKKLLERAP